MRSIPAMAGAWLSPRPFGPPPASKARAQMAEPTLSWRGKKLGGILSESAFRGAEKVGHVVVGIGLNLRHRRADFPPDIPPTATSLRLASKKPIDVIMLEAALWHITGEMAGGIRAWQSRRSSWFSNRGSSFQSDRGSSSRKTPGLLPARSGGWTLRPGSSSRAKAGPCFSLQVEIVSLSRSYDLTR